MKIEISHLENTYRLGAIVESIFHSLDYKILITKIQNHLNIRKL